MNIRLLPQKLINQIAAGEVVERPASALKELIENAIDADASQINIRLIDGGRTYFSVSDNGKGMDPEELTLAVERHATSKLPDEDLFNIQFLGFRGEALPSIASVAKVCITSRPKKASEAWTITIEGGCKNQPSPAAHSFGTTVEVKDLFYNTPARLKFLKSPQSEMINAKDIVNRLAMAYPHIHFSLSDEKRLLLNYPAVSKLFQRVSQVIGKSFDVNAIPIETEYEGIKLTGFVGLPTYTRSTSSEQYLFVNGRFIKDKIITGAIRGAFQGLISHEVHPVLALFLSIPSKDVDVNVHPAKTEVRFKDTGRIRGLLVASIRNKLAEHGYKTASTISIGALEKSVLHVLPEYKFNHTSRHTFLNSFNNQSEQIFSCDKDNSVQSNVIEFNDYGYGVKTVSLAEQNSAQSTDDLPPLGFAKAQLHKTYIISQTKDSIIITDQHAAHERLTYEKLIKGSLESLATQLLLIPEIVDLKSDEVDLLVSRADELKNFGFVIDAFGKDSIAVREIPALLSKTNIKQLIQDLADTLKEFDDTILLSDKMKDIFARIACHGSIRSGRELTFDEMNSLLRQMESCGTSGQCIHGRPTYIELKLNDIERLFGRLK